MPSTSSMNSSENDIGQESAWGAPLLLSGIVFLGFVICVYAYGAFGHVFVNALPEQIGDLVASQAKRLAQGGQVESAIQVYRDALSCHFEDSRNRYWALQSLGDLLIRAERYDEALPVLEECLTEQPHDDVTFGSLCAAYRNLKRPELQLQIASAWRESAIERSDAKSQVFADFYLGDAHQALERLDEALAAYMEGAKLNPRDDSAYHAAELLGKRGDFGQAIDLLRSYLPGAVGWRAESGARLLEDLQEKSK